MRHVTHGLPVASCGAAPGRRAGPGLSPALSSRGTYLLFALSSDRQHDDQNLYASRPQSQTTQFSGLFTLHWAVFRPKSRPSTCYSNRDTTRQHLPSTCAPPEHGLSHGTHLPSRVSATLQCLAWRTLGHGDFQENPWKVRKR